MKIIRLESENVKKIRAVEITPKGDVVRITGGNDAGKSSVLDSIMYALGGEKTMPSKPVRRGAGKARVSLAVGDETELKFHVERLTTGKGSYLKVTAADGSRVTSPQAFLDKVVGALSFDPLEFSRSDPKRQTAVLRELAGLDLSDLDARETRLMEERRQVNVDGKRRAAQLDGMTPPREGLPDVSIDVTALTAEVEAAVEHNQMVEATRRQVAQAKDEVVNAEWVVSDLQTKLQAAREELNAARSKQAAMHQEAEIPDVIDVSEKARAVKEAGETNAEILSAKTYRKVASDVEDLRRDARRLTSEIDRVRDERRVRIAEAKYPLPDLGVTEDGEVIYGGLPFSQASDSGRLKVSTAVAMALNPELRVIRIENASLLDSKSMETIAEMAGKERYQVWVEQVDETGKVGFYIEDGTLAAVNGEPV